MDPRDRVARFFGVELPALLGLNEAMLAMGASKPR